MKTSSLPIIFGIISFLLAAVFFYRSQITDLENNILENSTNALRHQLEEGFVRNQRMNQVLLEKSRAEQKLENVRKEYKYALAKSRKNKDFEDWYNTVLPSDVDSLLKTDSGN